jgi:hypothetical protein
MAFGKAADYRHNGDPTLLSGRQDHCPVPGEVCHHEGCFAAPKGFEVLRMATENACEHDMLVQIRWQGRKMAIPLSQLATIDPDESTDEAIGGWHYWVAQGYCLLLTHGYRELTRVFSERYLKTLVVDDEPIARKVQRKELDPAQERQTSTARAPVTRNVLTVVRRISVFELQVRRINRRGGE